jgi:hypothetical protein
LFVKLWGSQLLVRGLQTLFAFDDKALANESVDGCIQRRGDVGSLSVPPERRQTSTVSSSLLTRRASAILRRTASFASERGI